MSVGNINQIMTRRNANHKLINDVKEEFFTFSTVRCVRRGERRSEKPDQEATDELSCISVGAGSTPICRLGR